MFAFERALRGWHEPSKYPSRRVRHWGGELVGEQIFQEKLQPPPEKVVGVGARGSNDLLRIWLEP